MVLLHSGVRRSKRNRKDNPSYDMTLSFGTCLSVQVPLNPCPPNNSQYKRLEFWVADIQSTCSQSAATGVSDTQLTTLFVILPSTRIIFQSWEEKGGHHPTENDRQQKANISPQQPVARTHTTIVVSHCTHSNGHSPTSYGILTINNVLPIALESTSHSSFFLIHRTSR